MDNGRYEKLSILVPNLTPGGANQVQPRAYQQGVANRKRLYISPSINKPLPLHINVHIILQIKCLSLRDQVLLAVRLWR
jgi:hypothetical protein